MTIFEWYLLIALTTSIYSMFDVYIPVMQTAKSNSVNNVLTNNFFLSCFIFFCITMIITPFIIAPLIVPSMNARFRQSLLNNISQE
jgi:hypothetical protein